MIKLVNLTKYYGKLKVLDGLTFDIRDNETLAIIGPSGCGKSTLLKLLIRLEEPTSGQIFINDRGVGALSEEGLISLRQKVGMVFQSSALFDSLSVYENVAFALREHTTLSEKEISRVVAGKLKMVELEGIERLMPSELSGGMQKRVSIARALAFDPTIILYDEPTTGLDPVTAATIENLMIKLNRELKATSILVTHVMPTVYRVASRVVMLHQGKFIEAGTPRETEATSHPIVQKFIRGGA